MYVKFRCTEILDNLAKYLWRKIAHKRAVEYVKLCEGFWQTGLGITQGFVNQFCKISEDGRQTDKDKGLNIWTGAFYLSGNKTHRRNFSSGVMRPSTGVKRNKEDGLKENTNNKMWQKTKNVTC